jgi:hypothetical protein
MNIILVYDDYCGIKSVGVVAFCRCQEADSDASIFGSFDSWTHSYKLCSILPNIGCEINEV